MLKKLVAPVRQGLSRCLGALPLAPCLKADLKTRVRRRIAGLFDVPGARPIVPAEGPSQRSCLDPRTGETISALTFTCNLCGTEVRGWPLAALGRDVASCKGCGSSVRYRAVIHHLSMALHGRSLILSDWPVRRDLCGAGLSDHPVYADRLAGKAAYTNTYFHKAPRLDICDPDPARLGSLDFLISTEVFEHVPAPAARAFKGAAALLKPGGTLMLTVPYVLDGDTVEHFPGLHDFRVEERQGTWVLANRRVDGTLEEYRDLIFHGGPGSTLEMRVFSRLSLLQELASAGFTGIVEHAEPVIEWGIVHWDPWSLPVTARKA